MRELALVAAVLLVLVLNVVDDDRKLVVSRAVAKSEPPRSE
jgi:hypothetical protein